MNAFPKPTMRQLRTLPLSTRRFTALLLTQTAVWIAALWAWLFLIELVGWAIAPRPLVWSLGLPALLDTAGLAAVSAAIVRLAAGRARTIAIVVIVAVCAFVGPNALVPLHMPHVATVLIGAGEVVTAAWLTWHSLALSSATYRLRVPARRR
jgi:hypothetical protein